MIPPAPVSSASLDVELNPELSRRQAKIALRVLCSGLLAFGLSGLVGCQPETPVDAVPAVSQGNDGHDHDGHDHDGHDHDHDGHDHDVINADAAGLSAADLVMPGGPAKPKTLADAVTQLTQLRDDVAAGFAADDVDSIHDQLHDVGNLLESTLTLVDESELGDEAKKVANSALETLFDAFGDVDAKLHGEEGKDYADVSDAIDAAMDSFTAAVK